MATDTTPSGKSASTGFLDNYFGLTAHKTDVRTEAVAGLTTFLTMVYIVFVNPTILSKAGMDYGSVFVATCLAAAIATFIMGLYANYPIALAPGMGLNAFFAFTLVLTYKYTFQQALAFVLISGLIFILISVTKLREYVINAIPMNLKLAVSAGVGLFLGIIALQSAGIVVDHPATLITLGNLTKPASILFLIGFVIIAALSSRNVLGATLIGILVVAIAGLPFGVAEFKGIVSMPPSIAPTFLQFDFSRVFEATAIVVIFTLLFIDLFDTAGTLVGVAHRGGLLDKEGKLERMPQALLADSTATVVGAGLGTSNTTSYIESAAGVAAGGRTGLTAVFVGLLFLLTLFFSPLAGMIPAYASAAALLYVACVMARGLAELDWEDMTEYAPAVVAAIAMPLTYSIATGIGLGFITYALVKALAGRWQEVTPAIWVLAVLFAFKFAVS
ncbi:MAG: NCS2 family permease [Pseudorhodoplanes sp.]|uniref:NCS2 family permease n=1 Tax=Pseudorhodoplanes sp. TaxID=1934341 RepID=UPI003D0F44E0